MEEEFDKPTDPNESAPETDDSNLESSDEIQEDDSQEEKAFIEFRNNLLEEYKLRVFYMDLFNESSNRRINWAMKLAQMFGRYSNKETIVFLGAALIFVTVQFAGVYFELSAALVFTMCLFMTMLTLVFFNVAVNNFLSALHDLRLLKRGYCSVGYQLVRPEVAETTPDNVYPSSIMVAYRDFAGMIRTKDVPTQRDSQLFLPPVLMVFVDVNDPYNIAFFDSIPHELQFDKKKQMFTQEWKSALYALIPVAMMILYAISLYLGFLTNSSIIHQ